VYTHPHAPTHIQPNARAVHLRPQCGATLTRALCTVPVARIHADEELLPLAPNSLDGAVSSLALHWVNDLPGQPPMSTIHAYGLC
jgi:hypothetical protein